MNDQPTHDAVRRLAPVLLLVSLGLNLFFAGWLAGSGFRGHPPPPPPMDGRFGMLEHQLEGRLSPEGMAKVSALLRDIDTGMRSQFDAGESLRRQLHTLLTAEDFNGDDFVRAVGTLSAGRGKFDNDVARRVAEVMAGLSARDRAVFADAVLSMPPGPLG